MKAHKHSKGSGRGEEPGLDFAFLRNCVAEAVEATMALWDARGKTFWRSTEHRTREFGKRKVSFYPTVTLRCVDALLSLVVEFPEWTTPEVKRRLMEEIVPS